ncbi:MAG: ExeA family protein [Planctomycetota bacterium]|jgi:type II secretory pathway predicted ATPase ExeA
MYRQRFGLKNHVFPQDAQGTTFFETPSYKKLERRFTLLAQQPGLGVLTAEAGVGKTAAIRNLCASLPKPDYKVIYLCDTTISPLELYRQMALELGVRPGHRRGQLWRDLKKTLLSLVEEQNTQLVLLIDEGQHLSDRFLTDLSGFLNFAMDSRNLLTLWLLGQPPLRTIVRMKQHQALSSRVCSWVHLEPISDRKLFEKFLAHGLKAAGVKANLFADSVVELLFRASRGIPRRVSHLVREALMLAHEQDKNFVDDAVMEVVLDEEELT